jgi:hypothetical protein
VELLLGDITKIDDGILKVDSAYSTSYSGRGAIYCFLNRKDYLWIKIVYTLEKKRE